MTSMGEAAVGAPVFVDATGRRRRRIVRAGAIAALLALGYAAVLVVLALFGVRVDAPGLPALSRHLPTVLDGTPHRDAVAPAAGTHARPGTAKADVRPASAHHGAGRPAGAPAHRPGTAATTHRSAGSVASTAPAPSAGSTAGAIRGGSGTHGATVRATPTPGGRSATAPGTTKKASSRPSTTTSTHQGAGGSSATAPGSAHRRTHG